MSLDWYTSWVLEHAKATAAGPDAVDAMLAAEEVVRFWSATADELQECTRRLIRTFRTPKFPNEHIDAVGRELVLLRQERTRAEFSTPAPSGGYYQCPNDCTDGQLIVPHPRCVLQGRIVPYSITLPNGMVSRYGYVARIVVLCDMCPRGEAEIMAQARRSQLATGPDQDYRKKTLMSLATYTARIDHCDGLALLREYERPKGPPPDLGQYPNLARMLADSIRVPRSPRPVNRLPEVA